MSECGLMAKKLIMPRHCKACDEGMDEGYLDENSDEAYCTTDCLNKAFTQKELDAISTDELFWTDWYDEVEYLEVEE